MLQGRRVGPGGKFDLGAMARTAGWVGGGALAGGRIAGAPGALVGAGVGAVGSGIFNWREAARPAGREELLTPRALAILEQRRQLGMPQSPIERGSANFNVTNNIYVTAPGGPTDIGKAIADNLAQQDTYKNLAPMGSFGSR